MSFHTGETSLWKAVIEQALHDALMPGVNLDDRDRARYWLMVPNKNFDDVCEFADVCPRRTRKFVLAKLGPDAIPATAPAPEPVFKKRGPVPKQYEHDGKSLTLSEWAKLYGFRKATLYSRILKGWTFAESLAIPYAEARKPKPPKPPCVPKPPREPKPPKPPREPKPPKPLVEPKPPREPKPPKPPRERKPPRAKRYEHDGKSLTLREWAALSGVAQGVLRTRLHLGWTIDRAIAVPTGSIDLRVRYEHNGEALTCTEWAARTGITPDAIYYRMRHGWTLAEALTTRAHGHDRRGVGHDLPKSAGTGGGSIARDFPETEFSQLAPKYDWNDE